MMLRCLMAFLWILVALVSMDAWAYAVVVADSATHVPLPNASIYDKDGVAMGMSDNNGIVPRIDGNRYPITVRYIGFNDRSVALGCRDTVFLSEAISKLPELVVESSRHRVLHVLAYVREYSTLTTYSDTVFMFREKMVDYMRPSDNRMKFKGWSNPRVLTCKSYYHFTDSQGLDSVSDACRHHFSWSDWIGMPPRVAKPLRFRDFDAVADTLRGRYGPVEIWQRANDNVRVDVDVLADTVGRKWVPDLAYFFRRNQEFDKFKLTFNYDDVGGDVLSQLDLNGYSFSIESIGRGRNMFRFNRIDEEFFVSTKADIYILDKEYISVREAKKWENRAFEIDKIGIFEPLDAPELSSSILELTERVNRIDKDHRRLNITADKRLVGKGNGRRNRKIIRRALDLLKKL